MSKQLVKAVRLSLDQAGITAEDKVVAGVSGGPDSLALLHIMTGFMQPSSLSVAHLNHGLRPEADDEAVFVEQVAVAWGLKFRCEKVDVAGLAQSQGWTVEEAGRNARYAFLADVAEEMGAETVVVAHNADDQAETVLHHLLRGSGLRGLQGMRPVSALPGRSGIELIRPFLGITRAQIEAYCHKHELQPMVDSTNADPAYLRNRLRHELLPILEDFNPQIKEHLQQLADIAAVDETYLTEQCDQAWQKVLREKEAAWLRLDRSQWRSLPLSLRRRTLRRALAELRPSLTDISYRTIDLAHQVGMEKETGAEAALPGGIKLRLEYEHLLLAADPQQISGDKPQLPSGKPLLLPIPGTISLDGSWQLTASESDANLAEIRDNRDPWLVYLDLGQETVIQVRTRMPGELFKPLGMDGRSAAVQDIMVNRKLPALLRERWPVVVAEQHPLWLVGLHVDERAKVTRQTGRIIQIRCHR